MVTVTATDPSGLSATVNVTIKVTNVPEDPMLEGMASKVRRELPGHRRSDRWRRTQRTTPRGPPLGGR